MAVRPDQCDRLCVSVDDGDWRRRNIGTGWDRSCWAVGLALRAEVFDNPFEARHGFGDGSLHEPLPRVDRGVSARNPLGPDEAFRFRARRFRIVTLIRHKALVLAVGLAGTGNAELFRFAAPLSHRDLLVFANEPADFLAPVRAAAMRTATQLSTSGGGDRDRQTQRQKDSDDPSR